MAAPAMARRYQVLALRSRLILPVLLASSPGCAASPHSAAYGEGAAPSADDASARSVAMIDWPPEDAAYLRGEIRANRAVFLAYEGAKAHVVRGCSLAAAYAFEANAGIADVNVHETLQGFARSETARREPQLSVNLDWANRTGFGLDTRVDVGSAGLYRLAALAANRLPSAVECASASHVLTAVELGAYRASYSRPELLGTPSVHELLVAGDPAACPTGVHAGSEPAVGCEAPMAATIVALGEGPERLVARAAERRHVEARIDGDWALDTNRNQPFCRLPCDAWVLPGGRAYLRDTASTRRTWLPADAAPSSSIVIGYGKETKDTTMAWLATGGGLFAAASGTVVAYFFFSGQMTSSSNESNGSVSSGSSGSGAKDAVGGVVFGGFLMPLLAVAGAVWAGWGVRELLRAPDEVPVARTAHAVGAR